MTVVSVGMFGGGSTGGKSSGEMEAPVNGVGGTKEGSTVIEKHSRGEKHHHLVVPFYNTLI